MVIYKPGYDQQNNGPLPCPYPIPWNLEVTLHGKGDEVDVIKGADLEMQRLAWITQGRPLPSHESCRVENLSWLC